jgi:hypothetical protein
MTVDYDRGRTWVTFPYSFLERVDPYDFDVGRDVFFIEGVSEASERFVVRWAVFRI